jgi:LAO/AO transport system kinase
MDVFVRSMSARGRLGGLSTATTDAVHALDAFGKDVVIVETVGAGQNEVDIVRTADTVAVVVQPGSGDDVQMLKAGILEIGDVFVVNKADTDGVDRLVAELAEMLHRRDDGGRPGSEVVAGAGGHHGTGIGADDRGADGSEPSDDPDGDDGTEWEPRVVTTVATAGEGIDDLVAAFDDHADHLRESGAGGERAVTRHAAEIRRLVREDANALLDAEIRRRGGIEALGERVRDGETDPYAVAAAIVESVADRGDDGSAE